MQQHLHFMKLRFVAASAALPIEILYSKQMEKINAHLLVHQLDLSLHDHLLLLV